MMRMMAMTVGWIIMSSYHLSLSRSNRKNQSHRCGNHSRKKRYRALLRCVFVLLLFFILESRGCGCTQIGDNDTSPHHPK